MGSAHLSPDRPCPFCQGTGKYRDGDAQSPRDLRWTVATDHHTGTHVCLIGEITENARVAGLRELPRPLVLDLSGVRYINTAGSLWLVNLLEEMGGGIAAERCSPAVVRQLNLLPHLSDHLKVLSVVLPYECPSCNVDYSVVVSVGTKRPALPERRCGSCNTTLVPDDPVDYYFAFLPPP